jgi:ParB-like chromosome segregation protein Spo0J
MVANWPLRNARTRSKKQIAQIVQSIPAFGFTNPILADPELPAVMIT